MKRRRCSLCGGDFSADCQWCLSREQRLRPLTAAERRAHALQSRQARIAAAAVAAAGRDRLQRLAALRRPTRVGLVGCAKQKHSGTHPARHLYKSPLFRLALSYAERTCDDVLILSAQHEVVEPDQRISSYERKIEQLTKQMLALWSVRVSAELIARYEALEVEVIALAGAEYLAPLRLPAQWRVVLPLEGLGVGQRLRWLGLHAPEIWRGR